MQVSYKYFIGKTFWVPRVREERTTSTVVVDGHEYSREEVTREPYVKEKVIVGIEIVVTKNITSVNYKCHNVSDGPHDLATYIDEEDLSCFSKSDAMEIATSHAERGESCYSY